jgi:hypothetical protein
MYIIEIKLKKSVEKVKKLMFTIFFHHKICGKIFDICNMGCYNLTITRKNSGTLESDSLFGQKY